MLMKHYYVRLIGSTEWGRRVEWFPTNKFDWVKFILCLLDHKRHYEWLLNLVWLKQHLSPFNTFLGFSLLPMAITPTYTRWLVGNTISPKDTVFDPLKPLKIRLREWRTSVLYPINKKAERCKRLTKLLGSTRIQFTRCPPIVKTKTRASSWGMMSFLSSVGSKTIGPSIGLALLAVKVYWTLAIIEWGITSWTSRLACDFDFRQLLVVPPCMTLITGRFLGWVDCMPKGDSWSCLGFVVFTYWLNFPTWTKFSTSFFKCRHSSITWPCS